MYPQLEICPKRMLVASKKSTRNYVRVLLVSEALRRPGPSLRHGLRLAANVPPATSEGQNCWTELWGLWG